MSSTDKIKRKIDNTYSRIKDKCYNPNNMKYAIYGARGIKVCNEWLVNKQNFTDWCYKSGIKENLSIDRIDNNGDYSPENCRWADNITQARNKRTTIYLTHNNTTKTLKEWCKDFNVSYYTCLNRIHQIRKHNIDIDERIFYGILKPPFYYKGNEFIYFIKNAKIERTKRQQQAYNYYYKHKESISQKRKEKYYMKLQGEEDA